MYEWLSRVRHEDICWRSHGRAEPQCLGVAVDYTPALRSNYTPALLDVARVKTAQIYRLMSVRTVRLA